MKTYSFQQFLKEYPNDEICLDKIFNNYYGELEACPGCGVIGSKFYMRISAHLANHSGNMWTSLR